ncbi:MAG: hypothetical protein WCQ20_14860 [Synechococcaceae cyanobacterium ELA739]
MEGPLPWLLALGLGFLLAWGWARFRGRSSARSLRSKRNGARPVADLLPPQGLLPRSPHERLHDRVYLQRMLEAERTSASVEDDSETKA